tara:strand:+ start:44 stop:634 length:591 start_codon:yes stop_codon:yes gene_type:complete
MPLDFKTPNLCGANQSLNNILSAQDDIKKTLKNSITGGLDASALTSAVGANLDTLKSNITGLLPELPTIPDINLQSEMTSLLALPVGSAQYLSKIASLKTQFGDALSLQGLDFDSLIPDLGSGGIDVCSSIPNLSIPSGAGSAILKVQNLPVPDFKPAEEAIAEVQEMSLDVAQLGEDKLTAALDNLKSTLPTTIA